MAERRSHATGRSSALARVSTARAVRTPIAPSRTSLPIFRPKLGGPDRGLAVLLHGWLLADPRAYQGAIDRLTSAGYTVAFPAYERSLSSDSYRRQIRCALDADLPAWRRDVVLLVGHSAGAALAVDMLVSERGTVAPRVVILLAAGDGARLDGRTGPGRFRIGWDATLVQNAVLPTPRPHVIAAWAADDCLVGSSATDRICTYLRAVDPSIAISRVRLGGPDRPPFGHFFPLGGCSTYQLPRFLQVVARTDEYGGVGAGWPTHPEKERFWQQILTAATTRSPRQDAVVERVYPRRVGR